MCLQVDRIPLGPSKIDLHAWVTFPEIEKGNMQKASLDFRDLFLTARGYMKRSF